MTSQIVLTESQQDVRKWLNTLPGRAAPETNIKQYGNSSVRFSMTYRWEVEKVEDPKCGHQHGAGYGFVEFRWHNGKFLHADIGGGRRKIKSITGAKEIVEATIKAYTDAQGDHDFDLHGALQNVHRLTWSRTR